MFGLSASLFVCPLLLGLDVFKGSLYTKQVVKVKKIACRWSMIDRNGLEAKKNACFDRRLNVAFKCDNHFSIRKLHLTQLQAPVCAHSLVTLDHLFSTFKGLRYPGHELFS